MNDSAKQNKAYLRIILLLVFTYMNSITYSQVKPRTFKEYSDYLYEQYNIRCKRPRKFRDLKYIEIWKFRPQEFGAAFVFNPIMQSKDKDCILMYPMIIIQLTEFDKYVSNVAKAIGNSMSGNNQEKDNRELSIEIMARSNIMGQLRSALGHLDKHGYVIKDSILTFNKYAHVISAVKAHESYNADSLFIYDIPLLEAYKEKYTYCTGMVIVKRDYSFLQFLWLFTEEGKKKEKKYIEALRKKVWYIDTE